MYNYHSSTGMELYLLIDRNDYVINIPVKLYMKISYRTCKFVAQSCGPYLLHNAIDGVFLPCSPVP